MLDILSLSCSLENKGGISFLQARTSISVLLGKDAKLDLMMNLMMNKLVQLYPMPSFGFRLRLCKSSFFSALQDTTLESTSPLSHMIIKTFLTCLRH